MSESVKLPSTWTLAPLSGVADINPRSFCIVPSAVGKPVHFVPMSAVTEEFGGIDVSARRPLGEVQKGYTSFLANDVLLAKITPCMENGKLAVVPPLQDHLAFGSTEFHVVRANDQVQPSWLAYYLSQSSFRRIARQNMTGSAGQLRVATTWLADLLFPVAPAAEQTRIVTKLEELLSDLDASVAELKAAQKKLAQYRQSLLKAAVEGSDSDKPFSKLKLGEIVTSIGQGWSPRCERESTTDPERWAVMKTTAIQPLRFDGSHNKALPHNLKPRVNLELKSGDLLVTRAGPRSRVGITCLVRITRPKLILCDKAYRIRCNEERIDPSFLELVLNAPHMVQRIDELKTGISESGLNLTQDRFFSLEIPLPSIETQRTVVKQINSQVASIQDQEGSIERALKQSTAQRQNILRAAFAGQLVPQDPNDEPASVLLKRIHAERAAREAAKRPHGRKRKEGA